MEHICIGTCLHCKNYSHSPHNELSRVSHLTCAHHMLRYHDHWIKLTAHVSASGRGMQKPNTSPRSPFDERMASREGPMQWDIGMSQNFANTLPELHLFFPLSPKSLSSCARNGTVPCSPEQAGSRTNPAPWPACRGSGTSRGRRTMWWSPWNGAGGTGGMHYVLCAVTVHATLVGYTFLFERGLIGYTCLSRA